MHADCMQTATRHTASADQTCSLPARSRRCRKSTPHQLTSCHINAVTNSFANLQAQQRVLDILQANREAPCRLAALFATHLPVLATDAEASAQELMARDPPLTLEDFNEVLRDYRRSAEAVRLLCADLVRTGIYACAPAFLAFPPGPVSHQIDGYSRDSQLMCVAAPAPCIVLFGAHSWAAHSASVRGIAAQSSTLQVSQLHCRIDTRELKGILMDAYKKLETTLLTALRRRLRAGNERLIEEFGAAEVEVSKNALTSDEVIALKKLIQTQQVSRTVHVAASVMLCLVSHCCRLCECANQSVASWPDVCI